MADLVNIGHSGIDLRLGRSVYGIGATLVLMVGMSKLGAPGWSFTLLFVPFFFTINLAYQGLFKT